jgi:hypothetical protein
MQSGALIDTRPAEERAKDYELRELVATATVPAWVEKAPAQWRKFPIFDQNGSGSCVAQTQAKELGIMRWLKDRIYVHFSATDIYQRRSNKPDPGMSAVDVRTIAGEGVTLEALAPSQSMTDVQMDSADVAPYKRQVGQIFAVPNFVALPNGDIDSVASTIQATGKGVMVWLYFKVDEWTNSPVIKYPQLNLHASDTLRHSVCAVDFALINGKKHLIIEDSWGPAAALGGQRTISEEFFAARNYYAGYLMNFKFDQPSFKPRHTFLTDLHFGMVGGEVSALQDCLKYEGVFPTNVPGSNYFGPVTRKAVEKFQLKYQIVSAGTGFGRVGPLTRAKLNQLFSSSS